MNTFNLWNKTPGMCEETPTITAYIPENKTSDAAVVILPGGGYAMRADHEGKDYAEFLNEYGISAFVCDYRVSPHRFPLALLDARRAIKLVRYHADKYGINKNKIAIMGSSAGGHLAALTSTYFNEIPCEEADDIDREDFIPNAQILCYPVIKLSVDSETSHVGSCINFLGVEQLELSRELTPLNIVSSKTPPCFIWHTITDDGVPVENSLDYIKALKAHNVPCEFHMFPSGGHGYGLARTADDKISKHISIWGDLLINWLKYMEY